MTSGGVSLVAAIAGAIRRAGLDVLGEPGRLRTMVQEGLGGRAPSMRRDVAIVEAAATNGVARQAIDATDDSLDRFAQQLRREHGLDPAESRPVLAAIRAAGSAATGTDVDAALFPPPVAGAPPPPPAPSRSRPLVVLVSAVVLALLAGAVGGYFIGTATDDGSAIASEDATTTIAPSGPDAGVLRTQLATAEKRAGDLEADVKTLTGQVQDAQGQAAALQTQLQSTQGQLQSVQAQLNTVSAAFPVDLATLDISGSYTAGSTNIESCIGFNDECTTFLTRYSFDAAPDPANAGSYLISSYYFANKPLTRYGTTFVSQGSVDRGTAVCNDAEQATSYTLTLVPQTVALQGGTVVVSTMVGDLTYASPAGGGCRDASAQVSFTAARS